MLALSRSLLPRLTDRLARHQIAHQALFSTSNKLRDSEDPMWQAGDYPKTQEERERAARKYNLIIEDYEPYPEGDGWGDYPHLKCIGNYNKDWYDDYDDELEQKHFGQPVELHHDLYFWERIDPTSDEKPGQFPRWVKTTIFVLSATVPFAIYFFWTKHPFGRKLYPNHQYKFKEANPPGTKIYWFPTREQPHHHH